MGRNRDLSGRREARIHRKTKKQDDRYVSPAVGRLRYAHILGCKACV
jgi:hypothetical protein